jgi:VanZ family protein
VLLIVNRLPQNSVAVQTAVSVPSGDKAGHLFGYGLLAGLAAAAMRRRGVHPAAALSVIAAASLIGVADELTQPWWDRTCDPWDWAADSAGAAVGGLVAALVVRPAR